MSVRRSVVWGFAGQFTIAIASFVGSAIVARLISPREVGVYAAGMATMALITGVASFGTNAYVVRESSLGEQQLAAAFTVNLILNTALAFLLVAISNGAAHLLGDPGVAKVLRWLAIVPLVQILEFRPAAMLARDMRFKQIATANVVAALLATTITVTTAFLGQSYMSLAYGVLTGAALNAVGTSLAGYQYVGFRLTLTGTRPIVVFGMRMMSIGGVATIAQRVSEIMLGRILGLAQLGLYARASSLTNLLFVNIYGTATRIAFAKLSQDHRDTGSFKVSFVAAFEMITGVMWPVVIGLAVLSRPFIYHVYGPNWLAAAPILSILMVATFVVVGFGMNWELFILADETARQTRYEIARATFGTSFFMAGAMFGLIGAALGRVVEAVVGLLLYLPHMSRLADLDKGEVTAIYARGMLLTILAVAPCLAVMLFTGWAANTSLGLLASAVLLGIGAWSAGLALLGHPLATELYRIIRRGTKRQQEA